MYVAPAWASWTANDRSWPTIAGPPSPMVRTSPTHAPSTDTRTLRATTRRVSSQAGVPTGTVAATPRGRPRPQSPRPHRSAATKDTFAVAPVPASVTPNPSSSRVRPRSIVSAPEEPAGHQVVAALPSAASGASA